VNRLGRIYRKAQQLQPTDVQTFVVCAKTPRPAGVAELGYAKTAEAGVYHSEIIYVRTIPLLVLNELADTSHNAFLKCFASHKKAKVAAFATVTKYHFDRIPWLLYVFLIGLQRLWSIPEGEETMKEKLTPERVLEMGEEWYKLIIRNMNPEERLAALTPEERLAALSPEERLAGLSPKDVLAQYKPEDVLAQYKPEDVLAQYKPEERLAGLSVEEVEAWLDQQRAHPTNRGNGDSTTNPARKN